MLKVFKRVNSSLPSCSRRTLSVTLAILLLALGIGFYFLTTEPSKIDLENFISNLPGELTGTAITFLFFEYILTKKEEEENDEDRLKRLVQGLHADQDKAAIQELQDRGWLEDGMLKKADWRWFHIKAETNLAHADLAGVDLSHARLSSIILRDAKLQGATLTQAILAGSNLNGADLRRAKLGGADLHNADLRHADLTGADLTGADLTGAKTEKMKIDKTTLLDGVIGFQSADKTERE